MHPDHWFGEVLSLANVATEEIQGTRRRCERSAPYAPRKRGRVRLLVEMLFGMLNDLLLDV